MNVGAIVETGIAVGMLGTGIVGDGTTGVVGGEDDVPHFPLPQNPATTAIKIKTNAATAIQSVVFVLDNLSLDSCGGGFGKLGISFSTSVTTTA